MGAHFRTFLIISIAAVIFGCGEKGEDRALQPSLSSPFLEAGFWDDGAAEVAFYRVSRTRTPYGEGDVQEFTVGTYVVKHDFSPSRMSKSLEGDPDAVPSFKVATFYSFDSGSYDYRRSWVTNARQSDLRPIKSSFTMFDWCANSYREIAISDNGDATFLFRSDDYGNDEGRFRYQGGAYPPELIPTLVRALAFENGEEHAFAVQLQDGSTVGATARLAGTESFTAPSGDFVAERILVRYEYEVPSIIGEIADREEEYLRAVTGERHLLSIRSATGDYEMTFVEAVRSPYWEENVWDLLTHVDLRP